MSHAAASSVTCELESMRIMSEMVGLPLGPQSSFMLKRELKRALGPIFARSAIT